MISIHYQFEFADGRKRIYEAKLDPQTLIFQPRKSLTPSAWTMLKVSQCSHCPLKSEESPTCPIALNLSDLVDEFKDEVSFTKVKVTVTTAERAYIKETDVQTGLYGIMGLIMATSGCPMMNVLKPMARFHLPFSTVDETIMRSVSFYLMRQYFEHSTDKVFDWELKGLDKHYQDIQKVNQGIAGRFKTVIQGGDASRNTVTTLDCFSKLLNMALTKNLEKFRGLFVN